MSEWLVEGSMAINDEDERRGPLAIYRGSAQTWLTLVDHRERHAFSLSCFDRRVLLGTPPANGGDTHAIVALPGQRLIGDHEENRGHPADNERVIRGIHRVDCESRYTAAHLILQIRLVTLRGELSRDDGFSADQSP
jgi:hypothetical protein